MRLERKIAILKWALPLMIAFGIGIVVGSEIARITKCPVTVTPQVKVEESTDQDPTIRLRWDIFDNITVPPTIRLVNGRIKIPEGKTLIMEGKVIRGGK